MTLFTVLFDYLLVNFDLLPNTISQPLVTDLKPEKNSLPMKKMMMMIMIMIIIILIVIMIQFLMSQIQCIFFCLF